MYRFDVPRYRRHDPTGAISSVLKRQIEGGNVDTATDGAKGGLGGSKGKKVLLEKEKRRKKDIKMWWRPRRLESGSSGKVEDDFHVPISESSGYVPLDLSKDKALLDGISGKIDKEGKDDEEDKDELKKKEVLFFSSEEYLLSKTRDFNAALRQHPENLQLWLDFSAFQDEALELSSGGGQNMGKPRGALRATAEKQISILERGLEHHPGSDILLLALLDVASKICDHEEMERRWQRVLAYCPGSVKLWRSYLMRKREHFASFKAGEVALAHYQAIFALKHEKTRLVDLLLSSSGPEEVERGKIELAELDASLVEIVLLAISFRFQTGYTEIATSAVRAVLEFNWFAPEGWPEDALEMMFEEFYKNFEAENSSSLGSTQKILGDAGAAGWGAWISGEDASFEDKTIGKEKEEEEPGGWVEVEEPAKAKEEKAAAAAAAAAAAVSPWEEIAPAIRARVGHSLKMGEEQEEIVEEEVSAAPEETEEQLLARLGMDLNAVLADAEEELTPEVLSTWLDIECQRDAAQWKASRNPEAKQNLCLENAGDASNDDEAPENLENQDENLFSQVTWEDISPYIVSIQDKEAREKLLVGCLQLLGVSLSPRSSSSIFASIADSADEISVAASWLGIGGNSLEAGDPDASINDDADWSWLNGRAVLGHAVRDMPWWAVTKERHQFVLNILTTLIKNEGLKGNYELAFATLNLSSWSVSPATVEKEEEQEESVTGSRDWAAGRAFAKQLLSEQRDNLVLYAAFGDLEKISGRYKAARKVYSACLGGLQQRKEAPAAAHPPGLVQLVLGLSQLEFQESTTTASKNKKENSSIPQQERSLFSISMLSLLRAAPQAAVHAAARPLLFLGSRGKICLEISKGDTATIKQEEIVVARRGYQNTVLRLLRVGLEGIEAQEAVADVTVAAAAELVFAACSDDIGGGVTAALALYKQVIDAVSSSSRSSSSNSVFLEIIEIQRCALVVDAAVHAAHVVPPTLAREILFNALERYPSSPPLLRMLRSLEVNAHALTALRRQLNSLLSSSPSVPAWLMLIGVEIGANAARTATRAAFLRAVSRSTAMHSPVLWRCFLRFERAFGTPESLHRTFLQAAEACPWSKALWCDGLELLNTSGYSAPKELSEYLAIMKDKEIVVRTDVLEAVLRRIE